MVNIKMNNEKNLKFVSTTWVLHYNDGNKRKTRRTRKKMQHHVNQIQLILCLCWKYKLKQYYHNYQLYQKASQPIEERVEENDYIITFPTLTNILKLMGKTFGHDFSRKTAGFNQDAQGVWILNTGLCYDCQRATWQILKIPQLVVSKFTWRGSTNFFNMLNFFNFHRVKIRKAIVD